jgi:ATP-dependent 26S proteasome regulatory subunit
VSPAVQQVALHQLLNEMDGLGDDAAVLFLLTTNRPEVLEPALRAPPGRVDQAIEYPMPDADCRRRLIEIYGRGLSLGLTRFEQIVAKTDGVSPAFSRELLRKGAFVAAEDRSFDGERIRVTDEHLEAALRELLLGGELTQKLLGFGAPP